MRYLLHTIYDVPSPHGKRNESERTNEDDDSIDATRPDSSSFLVAFSHLGLPYPYLSKTKTNRDRSVPLVLVVIDRSRALKERERVGNLAVTILYALCFLVASSLLPDLASRFQGFIERRKQDEDVGE